MRNHKNVDFKRDSNTAYTAAGREPSPQQAGNRLRSSNGAPQDSSSCGSHVNDDTYSFESREGISEEGLFGSAPLSPEVSKKVASEGAATARTPGSMQSAAMTWISPMRT
eukprot:360591-Chlamydomonas_euryale.AAC.1